MEISEIRERILNDDTFVLEETKKIQYLLGLKDIVRYELTRNESIKTESVADHLYAMTILADYFLPLEDIESKLDAEKIQTLITWHDVDELETGDVMGYKKNAADRQKESDAKAVVTEKAPLHMQSVIQSTLAEYTNQETTEALFVKAIDKIDPVFYLYNDNGRKIFAHHKTTRAENDRIKIPYIAKYPYIKRFFEVIMNEQEKLGVFAHKH